MANEKALAFYKAQLEKHKKTGNPAHKHLKKVVDALENGGSPTEVLKNAIHAHCYECSHDSADPAGSHPKKCSNKECPLHDYRPSSAKEKAEKKAAKEVDPETKAKRQANAEKARKNRKLNIKEVLEKIKIQ